MNLFYRLFVGGCAVAALAAVTMTQACSAPAPPELESSASAVAYMLRPRNLARSPFIALYPVAKPSDYVNYIFSDMGQAEWPYESPLAEEVDMMSAARIPVIPSSVHLTRHRPSENYRMQLVISSDDDRMVLIADAYTDPAAGPVKTWEWEWRMPEVTESEMRFARALAENDAYMGMSSRSARRGGGDSF